MSKNGKHHVKLSIKSNIIFPYKSRELFIHNERQLEQKTVEISTLQARSNRRNRTSHKQERIKRKKND